MTLARRVIPCLDVAAGRVVKGVNFLDLRDMGDPVELAKLYFEQGADEVTFLDVTATVDERSTTYDVVRRTAEQVFIPLTVGGGVRSAEDVARLLAVGADKIGVNSAAIARPALIDEIADRFGAQVIVLSLDVKRAASTPSGFVVTTHGGRTETTLDALDWAHEAVERGAGELLVNSIDADGTKQGFDLELVRLMRQVAAVPVIASGGAGALEHFAPAVQAGADAVLAASVFHSGQLTVGQVKDAMAAEGIEVLMVGWMDAEALRRTLSSGRVTFWSRSRKEYWRKGDTSGHIQLVKGARLDCDGDSLLIEVDQVGAACHTGDRTCFDADDLHPVVGEH